MKRSFTLYIGGMLGPFGTVVTVPMVPELREQFGISTETVGLSFTVYMIPFAALLIMSGTLGERFGRRRTVRASMVLYAIASSLCALAPGFGWFLAGRGLQGVANAFITPLLVASLADLTPPALLGRAVGVYSAFQAIGTGSGPIVGGLAADVNWRIAFFTAAAIAVVIAFFPPPESGDRNAPAPPMRPLFTRPISLLGAAFFAGAAGPLGASVLVGLAARDELDMSGGSAGLLLVSYALGSALFGPIMGRQMDRIGGRRLASFGLLGATVGTALLAAAISASPWVVAAVWFLTGIAGNAAVLSFHAIGAGAINGNRGGGVSMMLAYRFVGHAVAQVWLPVFTTSPSVAFLCAASLGLVAVGLLASSGLGTVRSAA